MAGRWVCPATAKGRSPSIRIAGVSSSAVRRAGNVDNHGKGQGVMGTAPRGGGCGEFCLNDLPDEMELD